MSYPKSDPKTGRFLKTPKGQKTPKMIEMEKELGVNIEEDYRNLYLSGQLGQKRFAARWGCSRSLIFANNLRGGRRSWVQILDLPKKDEKPKSYSGMESLPSCENCGYNFFSLDRAHWVERANKGSDDSANIVKLCPNCHRALDRGDIKTIQAVRATLLYRVADNIISRGGNKDKKKAELIEKITPIIMQRRNTD